MFAIHDPNQGEQSAWRPMLLCQACQGTVDLYAVWAAFPANGDRRQPRSGIWGHEGCLRSSATATLGAKRILFWRGTDYLGTLVRRSEQERMWRSLGGENHTAKSHPKSRASV